MKYFRYIIILLFIVNFAHASTKEEQNKLSKDVATRITILKDEIKNINEELEDNIWITRYNNYLTYRKIEKELKKIKSDAKKYSKWRGSKYKELSYQLYNKVKIKENELELISEYKDSPIGKRIKPNDIKKAPIITNPLMLIEGFSYIQKLKDNEIAYKQTQEQLVELLGLIQSKFIRVKKLVNLSQIQGLDPKIIKLKQELKDFNMVLDIVSTTGEVYSKRIEQIIQETNENIASEINNIFKLFIIILILFGLTVIAKMAMKKYVEDDDKHYTGNKLINFIFIILTIFIILFSYIDNASYLVTVLGFASAGIAIALKDWFMSIFGWISIMLSGSINPGDRIKVQRDGIEVVGDVLDITLLKIAIREDTTLTSFSKNRRTGRVFFIPNNYVFTDMIANYTFDGLRTVWDVVDLNITFDSNHKKAVELAKAVATTHAKGYTELAKKRLQKLRKKYVLRNSNPEPRVFAFAETYGITISTWFHTNSHATLGLRSTIGMEILEAFKKEDDIQIAYPTQTLKLSNHQMGIENLTNGLFEPPIQG